jgi:CheY-like chemotaxis protein
MPAVLIVDDDHAFRTVLRIRFEEGSGFDNCVEVANAFEALEKSRT